MQIPSKGINKMNEMKKWMKLNKWKKMNFTWVEAGALQALPGGKLIRTSVPSMSQDLDS